MNGYTRIPVFFLASLIFTFGCNRPIESIRDQDVPSEYPVRADWLVASTPKAVVNRWFEPGEPPLSWLDQPHEKLPPEKAVILTDLQAMAILNTKEMKHFEVDPKPFLKKGLTTLFGTPAIPQVGISIAELDKRIAEKQKEIQGIGATDKEKKEIAEAELKEITDKKPNAQNHQKLVNDLKLDSETLQHGSKLYRNYCTQCHGLTGDGNGPGGKFLIPLPRDYRSGLFKFISTKPDNAGVRPNRENLYRTIEKGLDGSAMPAFAALAKNDIEALVSYVIHLSIRGETEYQVLKIAADKRKADDFVPANAENELFEQLNKILAIWHKSNANSITMEPDPYSTDSAKLEAAARGHRIFLDPTQGGCVACHMSYGKTAPIQFDSWGGLVQPRNFTINTFRVSRTPEELYTRIYCGIPGVGMPSHADALKITEDDRTLSRNRIWDVVYFIRTISDPIKKKELKEKYGVIVD